MCANSYNNIPTYIEAGESSAAKSATTGKMVSDSFAKGMELLTGDGMTTSCETEVIIDPNLQEAYVKFCRISKEEIRTIMLRNLQAVLIPEVRNVITSLPYDDVEAFKRLVEKAVETRSKLPDEKFRVHRLLINQYNDYCRYLRVIFEKVLAKAAEKTFRTNCNEAGKDSKKEVTRLIEQLVANMMDDEDCKKAVDRLIGLIESACTDVLKQSFFEQDEHDPMCFLAKNLSPEQFTNTIKNVSNSQRKELEGIPSVACILKSIQLIVPGCGIQIGSGLPSPYRLIDIVGFTNDGLGNVNELVNRAMLSKHNYDGIIYFASIKTINKIHESFLKEICTSMRPAKLIIISTFMDKDDIFDEDEVPTMEMIHDLNRNRIQELLDMVKKIATDDLHIILPAQDDVICISNKVSERKHGEAACTAYGPDQYVLIRQALERAANIIRKKIKSGVSRNSQYLVPTKQVNVITGQIINKLGTSIDEEYTELRGFSEQIHHWTLDAILWHLFDGREHVSNAKVWRNVNISTFANMQQICLDNLGDFKFSQDVKIGRNEDSIRVRNEFMANLCTELYYVVRDIILKDPDATDKPSLCKETIRNLALQSKYNKWKIIDDLRLCMMKAVANDNYLEKMLNQSINNALLATYDKLLY